MAEALVGAGHRVFLVGGIVRDSNVAHEAYMDVLAAVPPTGPGAAAAPYARLSIST